MPNRTNQQNLDAADIKERIIGFATDFYYDAFPQELGEAIDAAGSKHITCPLDDHPDTNPSFRISNPQTGDIACTCGTYDVFSITQKLTGCSFPDAVERVANFVDGLDTDDEADENEPSITVEELAKHKNLPAKFLKEEFGVCNNGSGVEIPYLDAFGNTKFTKKRFALRAKDGDRFPKGKTLFPYGLYHLATGSKELTLCEGESDVWTLVRHKIPALGIPGAKSTKSVKQEHVKDARRINIIVEPDDGGKQFLDGLTDRLRDIGFKGDVFAVHLPTKDASDLHKRNPSTFKRTFDKCCREARPVSLDPTAVANIGALIKAVGKQKDGWLWNKWIPKRLLSMLVGYPGVGKSLIALSIIETLVRRRKWPDGTAAPAKLSNTMWIDTEDSQGILAERIMAWNLPITRILLPSEDEFWKPNLSDPKDVGLIRDRIERYRPSLIVVDSLRGSHKGDENSSKIHDTLSNLAAIARDLDVSILVIHHLRKREAGEAVELNLDQIRGSSAISAMVRTIFAVDNPNPKSGRLRLSMLKSNLAALANPLGVEITNAGKIKYHTKAPEPAKRLGKRLKIRTYLAKKLKTKAVQSAKLIDEACKTLDVSKNTVREVQKDMGIVISKKTDPKTKKQATYWSLPPKKKD